MAKGAEYGCVTPAGLMLQGCKDDREYEDYKDNRKKAFSQQVRQLARGIGATEQCLVLTVWPVRCSSLHAQ